jgi:hypothetical protein
LDRKYKEITPVLLQRPNSKDNREFKESNYQTLIGNRLPKMNAGTASLLSYFTSSFTNSNKRKRTRSVSDRENDSEEIGETVVDETTSDHGSGMRKKVKIAKIRRRYTDSAVNLEKRNSLRLQYDLRTKPLTYTYYASADAKNLIFARIASWINGSTPKRGNNTTSNETKGDSANISKPMVTFDLSETSVKENNLLSNSTVIAQNSDSKLADKRLDYFVQETGLSNYIHEVF